jgi:hypothetical protein
MKVSFDQQLSYRPSQQSIGPPLIEVHLQLGSEEISTLACVDSGCTGMVFDAALATTLGVDLYTGKSNRYRGVGGTCTGFIHRVGVFMPDLFGGFHLEVEATFVPNFHLGYGLLGREGFFNQMLVAFAEEYQQMYFALTYPE